jgi:CRP-like cAMP-binding protein
MANDPALEMELMQLAFGDVSGASAELVRRLGHEYAVGDILFREGETSSEIFILLRGEVEVFTGPASHSTRLAVVPEGQILGEMSHFDGQPRSASGRALSAVHALVLDKDNFALIFQLHPKWTIQLVEGLAERLTTTLDSFS